MSGLSEFVRTHPDLIKKDIEQAYEKYGVLVAVDRILHYYHNGPIYEDFHRCLFSCITGFQQPPSAFWVQPKPDPDAVSVPAEEKVARIRGLDKAFANSWGTSGRPYGGRGVRREDLRPDATGIGLACRIFYFVERDGSRLRTAWSRASRAKEFAQDNLTYAKARAFYFQYKNSPEYQAYLDLLVPDRDRSTVAQRDSQPSRKPHKKRPKKA